MSQPYLMLEVTTGSVWEYLYENNDISQLKLDISKLRGRKKQSFKCKTAFYEIYLLVVHQSIKTSVLIKEFS